jgi:hypothetical protein
VADIRERGSIRQRTFLQACISYGDGAISTACTVVQLSAKGALLSVADSVVLTEEFEVAIPQKDFLRRARLVRRKDGRAGVEFLEGEPVAPAAALDIEGQQARLRALEAENVKLKAQLSALIQQVHRLTED